MCCLPTPFLHMKLTTFQCIQVTDNDLTDKWSAGSHFFLPLSSRFFHPTLSPNREPVDRLFLSLQVNEKFAIDLVDEEPPLEIHARHVWCDGGDYYFFPSINLDMNHFIEKQASLLLSLYISCHMHLHCTQIVYLDSASSGTCHLNPDQYCHCLTLISIVNA